MVCTTYTHQEVLQEQGVLANVGLYELLPLRAFRELICQDDSCSLWFGSSCNAGWKISHLQFVCDAVLGPSCPSLTCFAPHLPEAGRGVSPPCGQVGVSCCTHQFTGTSPEVSPLLLTPYHFHVASWVYPADKLADSSEQQWEGIRGEKEAILGFSATRSPPARFLQLLVHRYI